MFTKLAAVCLLVNDVQVTLDFYTKVMGLKVNYQDGGFANFVLDGTELAVFEKKSATAMFAATHMRASGGFLLSVEVDDVAATCAQLAKAGVSIFEGPKTTAWGQTVAYFYDPDKNIIELSQKKSV